MRATLAVARKEFRQLLHDRLTLSLTFGLPLAQLLLYGYALETRIRHIPAAVVNLDAHAPGRLLENRIARSPLFAIDRSIRTEVGMEAALQNGRIRIAIRIPPNYTEQLLAFGHPTLSIWIDGADVATSNYLISAFESLGFEASMEQVRAVTNHDMGVGIDTHIRFNESGRPAAYLIPGLIAILIQTITSLLMALSISAEREAGTLEQLLTTRLGPTRIIAGKSLAVSAIGLMECLALVLLMRYLFDIPVRGSLLLLLSMAPLLVLSPIGIGWLIAARAHTHGQALQLANLILLPSILLSGFIFPREFLRFPFDEISRLIPAAYLVSLSRDIVLRGAPAAAEFHDITAAATLAVLLLFAGFFALRHALRNGI